MEQRERLDNVRQNSDKGTRQRVAAHVAELLYSAHSPMPRALVVTDTALRLRLAAQTVRRCLRQLCDNEANGPFRELTLHGRRYVDNSNPLAQALAAKPDNEPPPTAPTAAKSGAVQQLRLAPCIAADCSGYRVGGDGIAKHYCEEHQHRARPNPGPAQPGGAHD